MKKKIVSFVLAVGLVGAVAGFLAGRSAHAAPTSHCWEADCFIDGWTPHWSVQFDSEGEAQAAAARHKEMYGDRHQILVTPCDQ